MLDSELLNPGSEARMAHIEAGAFRAQLAAERRARPLARALDEERCKVHAGAVDDDRRRELDYDELLVGAQEEDGDER